MPGKVIPIASDTTEEARSLKVAMTRRFQGHGNGFAGPHVNPVFELLAQSRAQDASHTS